VNHGLNSWMPPDSEPPEVSPFIGTDRSLTPFRLTAEGEPWGWWKRLRWRFGLWLELLGRKIQP
jgi:hypothetical protein